MLTLMSQTYKSTIWLAGLRGGGIELEFRPSNRILCENSLDIRKADFYVCLLFFMHSVCITSFWVSCESPVQWSGFTHSCISMRKHKDYIQYRQQRRNASSVLDEPLMPPYFAKPELTCHALCVHFILKLITEKSEFIVKHLPIPRPVKLQAEVAWKSTVCLLSLAF